MKAAMHEGSYRRREVGFSGGGEPSVRFLGAIRLLSVLSVYGAGVLYLNGWMDQDATWYGGSTRPWPHC